MTKPIERQIPAENTKAQTAHQQFHLLIQAIAEKELTADTQTAINDETEKWNQLADTDPSFVKTTKAIETKILKLVEKNHKWVPKNHYRKLWTILGMSTFGLPIGIIFGMSINNIGLLGVGLPIGMAIGTGVGAKLDSKALAEGNQLAFEPK